MSLDIIAGIRGPDSGTHPQPWKICPTLQLWLHANKFQNFSVAENYSPAIFYEKILEAMKKYWLAGVAVVSTCYSVDKNKL